jgi:uracil-DNA glycosylase
MTDDRNGSGLLSACNDDPTAAATHAFIARNQLTLDRCLFANVIPWWDGTRKISSEQRALAGQAIAELIGLLPALRAIVLVGQTAQRAWDRIGLQAPPGVSLWRSDHPGPLVRARYPDRWNKIAEHWPTSAALN